MAYQILENVNQPGTRQETDQLLNFTQSVIKMEREISQITKERKTSEVHNPQTFPEMMSYAPEWRSRIGLDDNIYSRMIESRKSVQTVKNAESVRLAEDSRQQRLAPTLREPAFESAVERKGILEHSLGPRKNMTKFRDRNNIIWTPPQTCEGFEPNICLSRVYFAQGRESNSYQVPACKNNCAKSDLRKFESLKLPPNNNLADRQKNDLMDKTTVQLRTQNAASILNSPVSKPSMLLEGMFQNSHPARRHGKHADKRSSSAAEEYLLPDCKESRPKSLNRDAIYSKPYSVNNEHLPPEKRSRYEQDVPETIVIPDEDELVSTRQCGNRESNLLQVVTDSEGRIRVNVANAPATERQNVDVTRQIIAHDREGRLSTLKTNHGERTLKESRKDYLETKERSSKAISFENYTPETCNHTSALITNDHQWEVWKRANCILSDKLDSETGFHHYTKHHHHCRKEQLCEGERFIVGSKDENDNIFEVEGTHLNEFIQIPRHEVPDNSLSIHAKAAKRNLNLMNFCDQTTQRERCTARLFNIPRENCSENYQPLLKNDRRYACKDRQDVRCQKTQISEHNNQLKGPLVGVSVSQTTSEQSFQNRTQRCSVQAPKEGEGSKWSNELETNSRQKTTVIKDLASTVLPSNKDDVQSSCSAPRSKASCSTMSSEKGPSLQPKIEKKNSGDGRYPCDWPACEKSYSHYSFLVLHKRIHTGEKPYPCSWVGCSKQFRRSDDYQRHYRVHTGAKPYVCVVCGKGFKRSDHRLFHYRAIHHLKDANNKRKNK